MSGADTIATARAATRRLVDMVEGYQTCAKCGKRRPVAEFPTKGKHRNGTQRYSYCKDCHSEYQRERNEAARNRRLQTVYDITDTEYDALLEFQGGVCAICRRLPTKRRLSVDHDHKTGKVRGLLDWQCNARLSTSVTSDWLLAAARYLDVPPVVEALGRQPMSRIGPAVRRRRRRKK